MPSYQHVDGGHGRVETRIATVSHDVSWLQGRHRWPGLKAIGRIEEVRERKGKKERLLEPARNHWKIENCFIEFWTSSRTRTGCGTGP